MTRILDWEGCHNVRDLGGLPTAAGSETSYGVVVRADSLGRLTETGWRQAVAYGVRRVVDLRFEEERARDGNGHAPVEVVHVSLFGTHDPVAEERWVAKARAARDPLEVFADSYVYTVDVHTEHVARAVAAVAEVEGGCVAVHCFGGKDRTGIVSALLLSVAGVDDATVAEDYAASDAGVQRLLAGWVGEARDDAERTHRERMTLSPAEAMLRMLDHVRARWGGAEGYLLAHGVAEQALDRLRGRLTG